MPTHGAAPTHDGDEPRRSRRAVSIAVAITAALGMVAAATACGAPTHQLVQPSDGPFTYELPDSFAPINDSAETPEQAFGIPNTPTDSLASDPVLFTTMATNGVDQSYQSLRITAMGGQYDPLDDEADDYPENTNVIEYIEINEPEVWGVRLRLTVGQGAADVQALVDRTSDELVVTRIVCTQACFIEQIELIDDIQTSWSLES